MIEQFTNNKIAWPWEAQFLQSQLNSILYRTSSIFHSNQTKEKCYVEDNFTTLKRNDVENFLQHLNAQQPTIRLSMETENDNTIPFLDTLVIKDSWRHLTTSIYRKTTHTDQHLSYDSHHPPPVECSVVKCLYDWSKNIITNLVMIFFHRSLNHPLSLRK